MGHKCDGSRERRRERGPSRFGSLARSGHPIRPSKHHTCTDRLANQIQRAERKTYRGLNEALRQVNRRQAKQKVRWVLRTQSANAPPSLKVCTCVCCDNSDPNYSRRSPHRVPLRCALASFGMENSSFYLTHSTFGISRSSPTPRERQNGAKAPAHTATRDCRVPHGPCMGINTRG